MAANGGWPAVASLSLGGDRSKSLDDAVEAVVSAGIPVVVAAGNDFGADSCTKSPAGALLAITVAATDINDKAAGFSNIGSCVDIWAPGMLSFFSVLLEGNFITSTLPIFSLFI